MQKKRSMATIHNTSNILIESAILSTGRNLQQAQDQLKTFQNKCQNLLPQLVLLSNIEERLISWSGCARDWNFKVEKVITNGEIGGFVSRTHGPALVGNQGSGETFLRTFCDKSAQSCR